MSEAQGAVPTTLHVTEIDGVPAVWADVPGPFTAGLLIRVGYVDEPLAQRGHSHMLEHLALHGLGRPGEHSNGQVDATSTLLHATGSPEEVADFLGRVARQLVDPPTDRLEDEKGVLRAEHSRRGSHPFSELQVWRWGARTYGLELTEELGLPAMSADSLRAWSRRFVGRSNAALWFTGPPPAGLQLRLPEGEHVPAPDPWPIALPFLPAVVRLNSPVIAWHGLVVRDWYGPLLARTVNNRLVDELRTERAAAYSPQGGYQPLTGDVAALLAMSDAVEGRAHEVVERVLGVVGRVADPATMPRPEEVASYRAEVLRAIDAVGVANRLPSVGWDLLHRRHPRSLDEQREALDQLTPEGLRLAALAAAGTGLAQAPAWVPAPPGWVQAPDSVSPPVQGRRHAHKGDDAHLVVGAEGVTLHRGPAALTVRFAEVGALGIWDDGGCVLIGEDGIRLAVDPPLWRRGTQAVTAIMEAVPDHRRVAFGPRAAESVPRAPGLGVRLRRVRRSLAKVGAVGGLIVLGIAGAAASGQGSLIMPGVLLGAYFIGARLGRGRT